jgi:T5orf172 domain-containing protein/uncharacterized protein DUF4041
MGILVGMLLGVALVGLAVFGVLFIRERQAAERVRVEGRQHAERAATLERQLAALKKYETLVDVEAEAIRMRNEAAVQANETTQRAQQSAADIVGRAEVEAARLASAGQAALDEMRAKSAEAEASLSAAAAESKRLEQTAQAMRNVIEGYGDRYVLPTSGLLDELAEEFSFTEAGQKLKVARDQTRQLIHDSRAADCDYVEAHRRVTAIEFVLDAFNGKVDTVLSTARHDNYGTLRQKVEDAFQLVNQNGRAFRNARITTEYLNARLEELRWAVTAQELKLKEREEQRALKERIREEERAQREYERAIKEAEKEEDTLRKAMEKARREVEKATEDQKAKYEQRLREIEEKLRVAEEKGQRAKSMAEQTRSGHVYIISNVGSFGDEVYKIGLTRRLEPTDRVRELGDAGVPFDFDIHAMIPSNDAPALEHALHKRFVRKQMNKVNPRKEFFRMKISEIKEEVERLHIQVSWTMAAEAKEFRESQAIDRALAAKLMDAAAWEAGQLARERSAEREPMEAVS